MQVKENHARTDDLVRRVKADSQRKALDSVRECINILSLTQYCRIGSDESCSSQQRDFAGRVKELFVKVNRAFRGKSPRGH